MMYSISGELLHFYAETLADKETGEKRTRYYIQLTGEVPTRDGDGFKYEQVTLSVPDLRPYQDLQRRQIRVPFGFFAAAKGNVVKFVPKGATPEVVQG